MTKKGRQEKFRFSIVFRLMLSIAIVMVVVFTAGNMVTVQLARMSLMAQRDHQVSVQQKLYQEQIKEAERRMVMKLEPLIKMLVEFSRGPLIFRVGEWETQNLKLSEIIKPCLGKPNFDLVVTCIRQDIYHHLNMQTQASINRSFITTAISFLLEDEDMVGIYVEDWDEVPYAGLRKTERGKIVAVNKPDELPGNLSRLEKEVLDDDEYIGRVIFFYTTDRIQQMREKAASQIAEVRRTIERNIEGQTRQTTMARIVEGTLFFCILIIAIFFVSFNAVLRPIQSLKDSADQLGQGNLEQAIDTSRKDEVGSLAKSFAGMRDAIRQNIDELKAAEEKYRSIFENSVEGIFQVSEDGRFVNANKSMARILGYRTSDELIASGTSIAEQCFTKLEDQKEFTTILSKQGRLIDFERQGVRRDNSTFWGSMSARPFADSVW